jgi:hypothetical protein
MATVPTNTIIEAETYVRSLNPNYRRVGRTHVRKAAPSRFETA